MIQMTSRQLKIRFLSGFQFDSRARKTVFQTIGLVSLISLLAIPTVAQEKKLRKLAPEQITLQTNQGTGHATVIFARKSGDATPKVEVTDAIGSTNSIPRTDIKFEWINPAEASQQLTVITLDLKVQTTARIDPNTAYKGKVILFWPDSQQTEDFTILDSTTIGFDLSSSKVEAVLLGGQPSDIKLILTNTGKQEIEKLSFSATNLESATTHRRADFGNPQQLQVKIGPGQEQVVSVSLPVPPFAGTYAGQLNVIANDQVRKSIPLTLTTRGPTFGRATWFPFVLFFVVLLLGYIISRLLENWFGLGGLQRAQAIVSLGKHKKDLGQSLDELKSWEAENLETAVPHAKLRLTDALNEVGNLLATENRQSTDTLVATAERIAPIVTASLILKGKLNTAAAQWLTPKTLAPVVEGLDAVDFPATVEGVDKYRQALDKVFEKHADTTVARPERALKTAAEDLSSDGLVQQFEIQIERMALIHRFVVAAVVFSTAYLTLYLNNLDFGTLADYFGVFFWSLGLTKTGTDILTKAKSSQK
jgi:hypothetical protein